MTSFTFQPLLVSLSFARDPSIESDCSKARETENCNGGEVVQRECVRVVDAC